MFFVDPNFVKNSVRRPVGFSVENLMDLMEGSVHSGWRGIRKRPGV